MTSDHRNAAILVSSGRYVAVDIRPRSIGFVVVENGAVIDSGIRLCDQSQFDNCLGGRLDRILRVYKPLAVLLKSDRIPANYWKTRRVLAAVKRAAKRHASSLQSVTPAVIHRYFIHHDAKTKYQIAEVVARLMPELAWKLPHKRKPWQSEHYRMSIFDAAAIAIAYLEFQRSADID